MELTLADFAGTTIEKSFTNDLLVKSIAHVGEVREFGGRKYIKMMDGWKYRGDQMSSSAKDYVKLAQKHIKSKIKQSNDLKHIATLHATMPVLNKPYTDFSDDELSQERDRLRSTIKDDGIITTNRDLLDEVEEEMFDRKRSRMPQSHKDALFAQQSFDAKKVQSHPALFHGTSADTANIILKTGALKSSNEVNGVESNVDGGMNESYGNFIYTSPHNVLTDKSKHYYGVQSDDVFFELSKLATADKDVYHSTKEQGVHMINANKIPISDIDTLHINAKNVSDKDIEKLTRRAAKNNIKVRLHN